MSDTTTAPEYVEIVATLKLTQENLNAMLDIGVTNKEDDPFPKTMGFVLEMMPELVGLVTKEVMLAALDPSKEFPNKLGLKGSFVSTETGAKFTVEVSLCDLNTAAGASK